MPKTLALNFDLPSYFYLLREVCGVSSQKEREVCGVEQWENTRGFASVVGKNAVRFLQLRESQTRF